MFTKISGVPCLTCIGDVATVLCVDCSACKEQQWKSHSFEVGEPLCACAAGWWSLAAPAHSTVCWCTVLLSIELPCLDSCLGEGAPVMMERPEGGPGGPKNVGPGNLLGPPTTVTSASAFITVTRGVCVTFFRGSTILQKLCRLGYNLWDLPSCLRDPGL